jgi:hypothetical protein
MQRIPDRSRQALTRIEPERLRPVIEQQRGDSQIIEHHHHYHIAEPAPQPCYPEDSPGEFNLADVSIAMTLVLAIVVLSIGFAIFQNPVVALALTAGVLLIKLIAELTKMTPWGRR